MTPRKVQAPGAFLILWAALVGFGLALFAILKLTP